MRRTLTVFWPRSGELLMTSAEKGFFAREHSARRHIWAENPEIPAPHTGPRNPAKEPAAVGGVGEGSCHPFSASTTLVPNSDRGGETFESGPGPVWSKHGAQQ
jgi:hypothetical protein